MKVLLTGSNGYIGRRLKQKLIEKEDIQLRLFVRNKKTLSTNIEKNIEIYEGDTFNLESLKEALTGIDVAYYLKPNDNSEEFFDKTWHEIKSKKTIWKGITKNQKSDGKLFWSETTIKPIVNKKNEIEEYIFIFKDISKEKLLENYIKRIKLKDN